MLLAHVFAGGEERYVAVTIAGPMACESQFGEANDVDTAVILLEHENGCLTTIDNSRQAVYGYDQRVEVFGSAGMAASENPLAHSTIVRTAQKLTQHQRRQLRRNADHRQHQRRARKLVGQPADREDGRAAAGLHDQPGAGHGAGGRLGQRGAQPHPV